MDKTQLHKILSNPFNNSDWLEVLRNVFGAGQLLAQPKKIPLLRNDKTKAAFELGNFTTADDRIIGLYRIELMPDVWLERNKVSLRSLLRDVYKYDVDGAIIVFDQSEKWRLSFVSEIKILNDEGEVIEQATEPKRYTYLLGQDEKVKTPSERLNKLAGKTLVLNDLLEAFSVEALNEEFYKIVAEYFYQLIGGKIGKGKKSKDYGEGILQLPGVPKKNHQIYQEFTVRLIGRTVFCWFLKMKKDDNSASLLPEKLLSSQAVKDNTGYYHSILERLFFQTLNTRMDKRVDYLPDGCGQIPFLNGGLFEPGSDDYYSASQMTGLSENLNTLKIEDQWFLNFFQELEKYNFTIDENSVTDVEVSVDPEMLGRIFENLLAEIDPDSGETARKATGSFYTPREIVDYMATESLVQYLFNHELETRNEDLADGDELKNELRNLFKIDSSIDHLSFKVHHVLEALDKVKILDPACGSGAFPMGVLQKIAMVLQKLDPDARWWKERQVDRISNPIIKNALREKLNASSVEYARKIGIIQNSLYGVDIQPIAAEISKLRCFLTLIVDENIDDNKHNRGIEPLPNLEFKFVTADTLTKLSEEKDFGGLFNSNDDIDDLKKLREEYLQSYGEEKEEIKGNFIEIQEKIFKDQLNSLQNNTESRAYKLSAWNPFGHNKADWFDPLWMYGVEAFDVVIGNPPYVSHDRISQRTYIKKEYEIFEAFADLYCYFIERGVGLLNNNGVLNYITSNSFLRTNYGRPLRNFLINNTEIKSLINIEDSQLFGNAVVNNAILSVSRKIENKNAIVVNATYNLKTNFSIFINSNSFEYGQNDFLKDKSWSLSTPEKLKIINRLFDNRSTIEDLKIKIRLGIATGSNEAFIINSEKANELISEDPKSKEIIKPILRGRDIKRYHYTVPDLYVLLTKNSVDVASYPAVYKHLNSYGDKFKNRGAKGRHWSNLRACAFFDDFKKNKIIWIELSDTGRFALCTEEIYLLNSAYFLIPPKNISAEFLLAILNSSIMHYILHVIAESSGTGTARWINNNVKEFPIQNSKRQDSFHGIVEYVEFINCLDKLSLINPHVPNSHLIQLFEEVIDAMVMELYFEEDFKKAGIAFIKYAERDFKSIERLKTEKEKIETIHQAYQTLRQKDNEIRNNLKLMDIKLADIVMPIKTAK